MAIKSVSTDSKLQLIGWFLFLSINKMSGAMYIKMKCFVVVTFIFFYTIEAQKLPQNLFDFLQLGLLNNILYYKDKGKRYWYHRFITIN